MKKILFLIAVLTLSIGSVSAQPRKEYPRPQFERAEWQNLNGEWNFTFDFGKTGQQHGWQNATQFDKKITVPFCPESALSGIGYTDFIPAVWYQRTISIPAAWEGKQVRLNFGAADYETHVFIDGKEVGTHFGTGSSFSFDITKFAQPGTSHNLVVWVKDDLRGGRQPGGKQCKNLYSEGCMYTRTTGIWQTVWLEPVDKEGLQSAFAVPDIDQQQLVIHPRFYNESGRNKLTIKVFDGKKQVAQSTTSCYNGAVVVLPMKKAKLWSPESPFLYDIVYEVSRDGKVIDRIQSYAGMRKVHLANGYFYLNNKPYYQRLVLDQGFYPDGIWTAPSDEALKRDIELSKAVGFNGARLHQKSFEERYYYWADRLGYLTWGESASWGLDVNNEEAARNFISEWSELVERDRNHPSLVTWTPFNETWDCQGTGVYNRLVEDVYRITKAIDPTRPVNDASGDAHVKTDIWSVHNYERDHDRLVSIFTFHEGKEPFRNQPEKMSYLAKYEGQPYMVDEFGGLPWIKPEERKSSWGYGSNIDSLEDFYRLLEAEVLALKACPNIVGFCYTQITDVEQEKNGIYYYDRTSKFDNARIKAIFELIPAEITEVKKLPIYE